MIFLIIRKATTPNSVEGVHCIDSLASDVSPLKEARNCVATLHTLVQGSTVQNKKQPLTFENNLKKALQNII
jgi:hypothetical protein